MCSSDLTPSPIHESVKDSFLVPQMKGNRGGTRLDYITLFPAIYEAIASLLGVPQVRKVSLLMDSKSYWDRLLVPEARDALTAVFNESCAANAMDNIEASNFLEKVSGNRPNQQNVKFFMDSSTSSDGKLNLEGFLQHYAEKASYSPKDVWKVLQTFGFRNDLSRIRASIDPTSGVASPDGRCDVDSWALHATYLDSLGKECKLCLMAIELYEAGMDANEEVTKTIVKRVCYNNEQFSSMLLHMTIKKLHVESSSSTWSAKANMIVEFISMILKLEDEFLFSRVKKVMTTTKFGLMSVLASEVERPSDCRVNEYEKQSLGNRYCEYIQNLCKLTFVANAVKKLVEEDPIAKGVKGFLRLIPGSSLTCDEELHLRNTVIKVDKAVILEVNGIYRFHSLHCDAGFYTRAGYYNNKPETFTLYKCKMNNQAYSWFISITPPNKAPGTNLDIDFFVVSSPNYDRDRLPPLRKWTRVNNNNANLSVDVLEMTISRGSDDGYDASSITPGDDNSHTRDDAVSVNNFDDSFTHSGGGSVAVCSNDSDDDNDNDSVVLNIHDDFYMASDSIPTSGRDSRIDDDDDSDDNEMTSSYSGVAETG